MRLVERVGDLACAYVRAPGRAAAALRASRVGQRLALEVLHDEEVDLVLPADVVTAQMCGWLSAAIARASRSNRSRSSASLGDVRGQDLDRDRAIEARVAGLVDLAHPARAEGRNHLVVPKPRTAFEGYLCADYRRKRRYTSAYVSDSIGWRFSRSPHCSRRRSPRSGPRSRRPEFRERPTARSGSTPRRHGPLTASPICPACGRPFERGRGR